MPDRNIVIEPRGEVTVVRLDRPPANAFCLELARELEKTLDTPEVRAARALVLTGAGDFFSGGLDLRVVPRYTAAEQRDFLGVLNRVMAAIYGWTRPVVAAVNGHAVAGAFVLVLATDYRVGPSGDAQLGLTEARVGIPFPAVPMIVVQAELGPQDVRYSTLYARCFGPEEALRRGVLDELRPPHAVLDRAIEVARDLAGMPAESYRRVKQQVRAAALARIRDVLSSGADPMLEEWLDPQARAASAAQLARS